ncbi:hypothetical protein [Nannocystis punicea]|uniref:Lipoprotein n=1 Tax=Nannocystis punicea TaxID=2995304 RepID=A0ABY7HFF6_9BACT|nr:hypothetical protein [Nannocystis poenicansa]WAS98022.1 hypothetical protein O0S08_17920 [Nannocystis poenicansa]
MRASVIVAVLVGGCARGETPAEAVRPSPDAAKVAEPAEAASSVPASEGKSGAAEPAETSSKRAPGGAKTDDTVGGAPSPAGDAKGERAEPPKLRRSVDGRCEPMPKGGDPCRADDGYCVLSWGEPGGYSEALWCRDGRWALEQERNLE